MLLAETSQIPSKKQGPPETRAACRAGKWNSANHMHILVSFSALKFPDEEKLQLPQGSAELIPLDLACLKGTPVS